MDGLDDLARVVREEQALAEHQAWLDSLSPVEPARVADAARARAEQARQRLADGQAAFATELAKLERLDARQKRLLRALGAAGNPGAQPRCVEADYRRSMWLRFIGKTGGVIRREVEPAWPIGTLEWTRSAGWEDRSEQLRSGITPTGRLVPMSYGVSGDNVHILFAKHRLTRGTGHGVPMNDLDRKRLLERTVPVLERACTDAGIAVGDD